MGRTVTDVALLWSVLSGSPVPKPSLDGLTVGLLRKAPELGDGRETEASDAAEAWAGELEQLGARVVETTVPGADADMWPLFLHEAATSHRETFPARADEYAFTIYPKLEAAQSVGDDEVATAYRAVQSWRTYTPEVDLYVSPCFAIDLPDEDADELEVRLPLSSFLRWVNLIGWAGLAVGNMQFVAPEDITVLAAGLAWERR
jgi:Asp-tRNA(Asn)/Glu-tRNA(Gln) amidotransferase A subunit family amidase